MDEFVQAQLILAVTLPHLISVSNRKEEKILEKEIQKKEEKEKVYEKGQEEQKEKLTTKQEGKRGREERRENVVWV